MYANLPPCIVNTQIGAYCEGTHETTPQDLADLNEAFAQFRHLVPAGDRLTGAQWLASISDHLGGIGLEPNRRMMSAIGRAMQVDLFPLGSELTDEQLKAVCEEELMRLGAQGSLVRSRSADTDRPSYSSTFLDLPKGYVVQLQEGYRGTMAWRMLDILSAMPVGPETFTRDQNADFPAQIEIILHLISHHGYEVMCAQSGKSIKWGDKAGEAPYLATLESFEQVKDAVVGFFGNLDAAGWEAGPLVNICRRAPLINPIASIRPFECLVHSELIGWRVPQALVERCIEMSRAQATRARMTDRSVG